jgi:ABC-type glycerol-3-phosphate transport system substrate-binding protein
MGSHGFSWKILTALWVLVLLVADSRAQKQEMVTIRLANIPLRSATGVQNKAELAVFDAFFRKYPNYRYERVTGLALPEGLAEAQQMMAFAADRAPDVFDLSIRQVQNYIRQGLLYPVDDLIREYRKRNPQWKPPSLGLTEHHYDAARGPDGKLYAVVSDYWILGLWYRRDLFEEAGIVPPRPPKDWQEFFEFAQRLTDPEKAGERAHASRQDSTAPRCEPVIPQDTSSPTSSIRRAAT